MRDLSTFEKIFIHKGPVDFRKSINGLSVIVEQDMNEDIQSNSIFIFTNRSRNRMKMLYFDKSGFALWLKRLEAGKFPWAKDITESVIEIPLSDLRMLLDGVNFWTRFEKVHFEKII